MVNYCERGEIPDNVWLGVTVERPLFLSRADLLRKARGTGPKFIVLNRSWPTLVPLSSCQASAKLSLAVRVVFISAIPPGAPSRHGRPAAQQTQCN
jgi:hypothetical protein